MNESGLTFGLFVTGEGEARFLPKMFQAWRNVGPFRFEVQRKIAAIPNLKPMNLTQSRQDAKF